MKVGRARRIAVASALALAPAGSAIYTLTDAAPVSAQSNCAAGTWGNVYAWGDCRGSGKWQLKVSCTWWGTATSPVLSGAGHIDVKCPIGSARSASIIYR